MIEDGQNNDLDAVDERNVQYNEPLNTTERRAGKKAMFADDV